VGGVGSAQKPMRYALPGEREFLLDNLMVLIHSIIEMISVDRPCAMEV